MNSDKDAEICPNCGLRMIDPEVCDFCDYKRHENLDLYKTFKVLTRTLSRFINETSI